METDFFEAIPAGSDAYLLSHILHDWDDECCGRILANCRKAMDHRGRLLVVEMVVPRDSGFSVAKLLDLEVLVMGGGRERTADEFRSMLGTSGFKLERIIPTKTHVSLLECFRQEV